MEIPTGTTIGRSYEMDVLKLNDHGRGAFVLSTTLVMVLVTLATLVMSLGPGMMSRAGGRVDTSTV